MRSNVANSVSFTDSASSYSPVSSKPFPTSISRQSDASPSPAAPRRLPARPPERAPHDTVAILLAQAALVPPLPPRLLLQIVLLGLSNQNLRLLRQTRHVREARRSAARTHAHEALLRFRVKGLGADVARLALRVLRASLRSDRNDLRVLLICVILLSAASFFYFLTELVVAALFPVLFLACGPTVARTAAAAFLAQG